MDFKNCFRGLKSLQVFWKMHAWRQSCVNVLHVRENRCFVGEPVVVCWNNVCFLRLNITQLTNFLLACMTCVWRGRVKIQVCENTNMVPEFIPFPQLQTPAAQANFLFLKRACFTSYYFPHRRLTSLTLPQDVPLPYHQLMKSITRKSIFVYCVKNVIAVNYWFHLFLCCGDRPMIKLFYVGWGIDRYNYWQQAILFCILGIALKLDCSLFIWDNHFMCKYFWR